MNGDTAATRGSRRRGADLGAVAVETALVLPILLLLIFGIIEFGRLYNAQLTLTHGAREGVREYVITGEPSAAESVAANAITSIPGTDLIFVFYDADGDPSTQGNFDGCDPDPESDTVGDPMTMKISYTEFVGFIPLWGDLNDIDLEATGTMRCGG